MAMLGLVCALRDIVTSESWFPLLLQYLGWYDPIKKETNLNAPAIKKWLEVGAKPSETVERLLKKAMVMD